MILRKHRWIALVLIISLLLSVTGVSSAYAEEKGEEPICEYYGPKDGIEVEELRTETAKQYLLPDGTMQYIASPDRIHWKDESGSYVDIDNTIIDTTYDVDGLLYTHTNKSNDIKMFFADDNQQNEYPVRIEYQEYELSYGLEETQITYIPEGEATFLEILSENVCLENAVLYQTDQGYNLVYIPKNSGEKEYIIIHEPMETYSFMFRLRLEGLIPEQTERGVVLLNDEGNPIFDIGGLFAVDSNEIYCDEVEATLLDFDEDTAFINLEVNQEWMEEESREYPVVVDPTTFICGEYVTYDSYVSSVDANVNFYVSDYLRMGKDDDYGKRRTAIKFDLPSVASSSVTSAKINIRLYSSSGSLSNTIYAYPITSTWASSSITWNNKPSYTSAYKSSAMVPDTWHDTSNWYSFGATPLVQAWLSATIPNYGAMLIDDQENNTSHWSTYYSSDYGYPNRPELMVTYTTSSVPHVAKLIAIPYSTHTGHANYMSSVSSSLQYRGYTVVSSGTTGEYTISDINNIFNSNYDVFITKGHGAALSNGVTEFLIRDTYPRLYYTSSNILNFNTDSMLSYELVVFLCCNGANGGYNGTNLPSAAVAQGATASIGFTSTINCSLSTSWIEDVFYKLKAGYTVSSACSYVTFSGNSYDPTDYEKPGAGLDSYLIFPSGGGNFTLP